MSTQVEDNNASINISPAFNLKDSQDARKRSLKAFKNILEKGLNLVGKASIPFIGVAASATIYIIDCFVDYADAPHEWYTLSEKVEQVSALLEETKTLDGDVLSENTSHALLELVERDLEAIKNKLAARANQENLAHALVAFLDANDVQAAKDCAIKLDGCISKLTSVIALCTGKQTIEIRKKIEGVISEIHAIATNNKSGENLMAIIAGRIQEGAIAQTSNLVADGQHATFKIDKSAEIGSKARVQSHNIVGWKPTLGQLPNAQYTTLGEKSMDGPSGEGDQSVSNRLQDEL